MTRKTRFVCSLPLLLCLAAVTAWTQAPSPDDAVKRVWDDPKFKAAMAAIDKDHDRLVAEIIQLTEIPAPPFKEDARGAAYLEMLRAAGLTNVSARTTVFVQNVP